MKKETNFPIILRLLPMTLAILLVSCLGSEPKDLTRYKLGFDDSDTGTPETFKFNFAYRDIAAASPLNKIVYLQGATDTKTTMISTCNLAATNCVCEFLKSDGTEILEYTPAAADSAYDETGNFYRCNFTGTAAQLATLAKVRIRNQNSTVVSAVYDVDSSLTAQKILGDELNVNSLRTIYRFSCLVNYLQKMGTSTSTGVDCSDKPNLCGSAGNPNGDLCLLQVNYPYHLYASNSSDNLKEKQSDVLYFGGNFCGLQVKQIDCTGAAGVPVAQYGLYGEAVGVFNVGVQLSTGPNTVASTYGYAATPSTYNGVKVCPPGMELRVFYRTSAVPQAGWIGNNMVTTSAEEVSLPGSVPSALAVNRVKGYDCTGTGCHIVDTTLGPQSDGQIWSYNYTEDAASTQFCVIPSALLPN